MSTTPPGYAELVRKVVAEAEEDKEIIGVLLTGSMARGDALPGTDIDVRFILVDGVSRPFDSRVRDGILLERGYADAKTARAALQTRPMNVYAYLDGQVLYDPHGVVTELSRQARECFDGYEIRPADRTRIAFLLGCSRDKIRVAVDGDDPLRAAFVAGTTSWGIMEGLWAANNKPLPPNSSIRPHLRDLRAPRDVHGKFERLFLGDTPERVHVTLELLEWIIGELQ